MDTHHLNARRKRHVERVSWAILSLIVAIGLAGYYGPWIPHKAAGLVVIGVDLAEYVKFLPDVIAGRISLRRELFYLPLFAASIGAGLLVSRRTLPAWSRVVLAVANLTTAAAMLPPAWSPPILLLPEFRLQAGAILLCWLLIPGALLTRHLPKQLILIIVGVLSLAAAIAPAWGFLQIRPGIEALYHQTLPLGWGFWVNAAGFLGAAIFACAETLRGS
jgi:hypothetical protein